jgi:hypothetical protein
MLVAVTGMAADQRARLDEWPGRREVRADHSWPLRDTAVLHARSASGNYIVTMSTGLGARTLPAAAGRAPRRHCGPSDYSLHTSPVRLDAIVRNAVADPEELRVLSAPHFPPVGAREYRVLTPLGRRRIRTNARLLVLPRPAEPVSATRRAATARSCWDISGRATPGTHDDENVHRAGLVHKVPML